MDDGLVGSLSNEELLAATQDLVRRSCEMEADLLVHLGEIDHRKLYRDRSYGSMYAFCTRELGFSEGAAYNRIYVARTARKLPALLEAVRSGRVHLAGLRLLAPHLTKENHAELLEQARGRTKEEIAQIVAAAGLPLVSTTGVASQWLTPISDDVYKVQFNISREFRHEIRDAQDLLRHRIPDGNLAAIFQTALKLLVAQVRKERFALGRKARGSAKPSGEAKSRHVPAATKRAVFERDGGRCTFVDERGKRCEETGALEIDHIEGYARTHRHDLAGLRLLCRVHNQHAAEKMYGRDFMDAARQGTCPGTSPPG
ncbi:MAG TPA: HNH endonuclease signature motif containing protein [Myxococcales bacterium]|jgi:hypothetical protein|nr:HNH endonuclease signature motif containing protein [Myxococcales bacterium]